MGVAGPPGDGPGFAAWVRPWVGAMARLAGRLAVGVERDDVVQEALARAWAKRHQYDASRGTPAAWLLAITADQARKAVRRTRPGLVALWDVEVDRRVQDRPDLDARMDVEDAVAGLPARQRLAVDCYYFADLSIAETAAVMGCSEGTVKSTLSDARARLRVRLEVSE
ncbi:RNA polymerase sigma factor [Kribbella sp.]|uniref:RNA polymerase sigma factor n=1 Tax=Kribbella sp. TaxID=1871183 RepID=UPI002D707A9F|nr:RNA polymerase sigma factor [Kribbella sp.]HZX02523.1 RNA polymerase sigma factor [Kribbella sp.]